MNIILASTSPRRKEIFELLQISFEVHPPKFVEASDIKLTAEAEALLFAREKALSLQKDFPDSLMIGSDTIIELEGKKLGKPQGEREAFEMLNALSGKTHRVLTGLAVVEAKSGLVRENLSVAEVTMKAFSETKIAEYICSGEPMDKAGAYAVQGLGSALIEEIRGDFFTVVGLPLRALVQMISEFGVKISVDVDKIYSNSGSQKVKASR